MKKSTTISVIVVLLCLLAQPVFAQTNKELAKAKCKDAIIMEDEEGKIDDAIKTIQESIKLDPDNIEYPYELSYAYSIKKEYKKASDILEKLIRHKDVYALIYQALGNSYDYQGMPEKAIETYEKGLKQFPTSGILYLELGNMQITKKEYNKALDYYEKGIKVDPKFPSNYYWASKLFCSSDEEVWGMIYGEIFMNLERTTKRTAEISKMLFDTYKSQIKFTSDTSLSVNFSKEATIDASKLKDPKDFKLPFGTGTYEILLMMCVLEEKKIDINSMNRIRKRFVKDYFEKDHQKDYPNVLFDYQQKLLKAGHMDAYNHWLLMKGDVEGFKNWQADNETEYAEFMKWFDDNKIQIDETHRFYREQYD